MLNIFFEVSSYTSFSSKKKQKNKNQILQRSKYYKNLFLMFMRERLLYSQKKTQQSHKYKKKKIAEMKENTKMCPFF